MSDPRQDPAGQPATGMPVGTRFTYACPSCGNGFAVTFPPGVEPPPSADALRARCQTARDATPKE